MRNEQRPKWVYPLLILSVLVMLFYPAQAPWSTGVKWLGVASLLGCVIKLMSFIPSKNQSEDESEV